MRTSIRIVLSIVSVVHLAISSAQVNDDSLGKNGSFNRFVIKENAIPLPDGNHLSALVVRHEHDSLPTPVVLLVNCYPNSYSNAGSVKRALREGYTGVVVYSRGKERSTGVFNPFEDEANDMYDIIDWISRQPWCNGKIGMFGGSYLGFTQWAALKKIHPALKTIVPQVAAAPGIDFPIHNGVFMSYTLRWINYTTNGKFSDRKGFNDDKYWKHLYNAYYRNGAAFSKLDSLDKSPDRVFQRWMQHPAYDTYWSSMIPSTPAEYAAIDIPILTITGYFDADQRGAMHYYNMHSAYGNKEVFKNHYLLIGPWDHIGAQDFPFSQLDDYKVDSLAVIPVIETVMDWFDYVLKGKQRPAILKDRVNHFVMGDRWKHAPSLEKMNKDTVRFFLAGKQTSEFYKLSKTKSANSEPILLKFDLTDLRDSIDVVSDPKWSPLDNSYILGHNQLIFETNPLTEDMELNGSPVADLFMSLSSRDLDLELKYYEVRPGQKGFILSTCIQRVSLLADRSQRKLVEPGVVNSYTFANSYFTSKKISKGSVIRLVVKPVNVPYWQKNYGSGKDVSSETMADATPITIKLFTNNRQASSISLPGNILK